MEENIQNTDNLMQDDSLRAEALTPQDDTVAEDFFSQLDKQVMGETLEQPIVEQQEPQNEQPQVVEQEVAPEMDAANLESLTNKLSSSLLITPIFDNILACAILALTSYLAIYIS